MKKFLLTATLILTSAHIFSQEAKRAETVSINGKKIYYEVYGEGPPLLLLHGYSMSSKSWQPYVSNYDQDYEVYLIDLTGHGKSEAFKEDLSIESVGKDLHALIQYLKIEKIKAIGFSFGGDVLFQLALIEPSLIESMIAIGAVGSWSVKDFPEYVESYTFENIDNFDWMKTSHSNEDQIRAIFDQFKNYTVRLSDEELKTIQPEVLIMLGDDDVGIRLAEVARVRKNLPKSDLWILPNVSHGAHQGESKEEFIRISKDFLSKTE